MRTPRSEQGRFALWLIVISIIGLAARVGYVLAVAVHVKLVPDSLWYQLQAGTIATVVAIRILRGWGAWNPVSQTRAEEFESRTVWWQLVGWGFSLAIIIASAFGVVILRRRGADLAPLIALIVGVTIILAVSYGDQRFRVCAEPVFAVLAGAVVAGWTRRRGGDQPNETSSNVPWSTVNQS